jgi:choline dehydrogenase
MQDNVSLPRKPGHAFDVIVCGSGAAGSVVARRLSDDPNVNVLLLEAGGLEYSQAILDPGRWTENVGGPADWAFLSEPAKELGDRSLLMSMGKVVGGSTSINAMIWAHGHQQDWDHYAEETGDQAWSYQSVLDIYRSIENYGGDCDLPRGKGGPVLVNQPSDPHPIALALLEAARASGIPTFPSPNGRMMEAASGCAIVNLRTTGQQRLTIFDTYVRPVLGRRNLTLLTEATVHHVVIERGRAVGVDVYFQGRLQRFTASQEVVLSTGAINTPRILMQSGIGNEVELKRLGIPLVQHLPGVGENLQDHLCFPSVYEYRHEMPARGNGIEATVYATSELGRSSPDILVCQGEFPFCSPEIARQGMPEHGWSLFSGLAQPKSRGRVRLRSAEPTDPVVVQLNALSEPDDLRVARAAVELSREIGAAEAFRALSRRQYYPGEAYAGDLDRFIRDGAVPFLHQTCAAKMGRDPMSVVDCELKVYGLDALTVADGSVFPRIPTGNTMAPCVVVGERASQVLRRRIQSEKMAEARREAAI